VKIYLIGSMRNPKIQSLAKALRRENYEVFDDWFSPGEQTDEQWQIYERKRGRSYKEALAGHHAKQVFEFDKKHLDSCDAAVLVLPAGRSAHLELGYLRGKGVPAFILLSPKVDRFDIMYQFASGICETRKELLEELRALGETTLKIIPIIESIKPGDRITIDSAVAWNAGRSNCLQLKLNLALWILDFFLIGFILGENLIR
jgi:nucleoside 2-deoxyribosyltransferase